MHIIAEIPFDWRNEKNELKKLASRYGNKECCDVILTQCANYIEIEENVVLGLSPTHKLSWYFKTCSTHFWTHNMKLSRSLTWRNAMEIRYAALLLYQQLFLWLRYSSRNGHLLLAWIWIKLRISNNRHTKRNFYCIGHQSWHIVKEQSPERFSIEIIKNKPEVTQI